MQCNVCGAEIPPGASVCPNCGTPVTENSGNFGPFQERVSHPTGQAAPYQPLPSSPSGQPSVSPWQSPPAPAFAAGQTPTFVPPVSPPQPQPLKPNRRPRGRGITALLLILAILLMLSGLGLILYSTAVRPAQLRVQATQTVGSILTQEVRASTTANVYATGTAGAYAHATSTAQAQATVVAMATATAYQAIYTNATSGTPILNNSLSGNSASNWDEYNAVGGGGCQFTGGALHVGVQQKNYFVPCFAQSTNFTNFAYQADMTIFKGDEGGLIFRSNAANTNFYYFRVGHDGNYALFLSKNNSVSSPIAEDFSTAIKTTPGQTNLLTVVARGSDLYFFVNKQFVGHVNDGSFASGSIGVTAGDLGNTTDVAFTNAEVWAL